MGKEIDIEKSNKTLGNSGLDKIKDSIDTISENKKIFAKNLYKKIKFMDKTLDDLQKKIKKEGPVIETRNGNGFTVVSENPAQKAYTSLMGKYNTSVKILLDLIPENTAAEDEFMDFLKRG